MSKDAAANDRSAVPVPLARPTTLGGWLTLSWALLGPAVLIGSAVRRLLPMALEPLFAHSMSGGQWALYTFSVVFNGYAEGYRGFQKGFAPRVVGRAFHLGTHPNWLHGLLAPFFAMGFLHSSLRRKIVSTFVTLMVVMAVWLVRKLEQPWRGIVDAGVVVGLVWGLLVYAKLIVDGLRGTLSVARLDLPGSVSAPQA